MPDAAVPVPEARFHEARSHEACLPDALPLARALIRAQSVTPNDDGAQAVLGEALTRLGFVVTHLPFGDTANLFARRGEGRPHLCFAGHTDVVPPGKTGWSAPPFAAEVREGVLFGRGACDMKGAIACFVSAVASCGKAPGSVSLLITGDEEGLATDGTVRVLQWMQANNALPDFCLVGEPTNPAALGEAIKIGRRGSLNAHIVAHGIQGHVAYPQRADNPVHRLLKILSELTGATLDEGSDWFEPSSLQVTSVDVGNPAKNVIPSEAEARLNIRFNDLHTGETLSRWLEQVCATHAPGARIAIQVSGEAFLTAPHRDAAPFIAALRQAVMAETGRTPSLETGGGTSDARFIARYCPVAEFGLVGASMHKTDECVALSDLERLTAVYRVFLEELSA